jgi:hypothetical protein
VRSHDIKTLAENWVKPRLEECRLAFPRGVQAKLAEFAARGTAISPVAYAAVEKLAYQEVERCGQLFLSGYKEAFAAVSDPISAATLDQMKAGLDALLSSESARVLKTIRYVRDVCKPSATKDSVELRTRTQQKLVAELDLFVAKLNTERGIPTFGWKPDSVTFRGTYKIIYEQGELASPEDLQGLIELLYDQPECEVRYYYQDGSAMDSLLADAIRNRHILLRKSEQRFFKHPEDKRNYVKIPSGAYKFDWQKDVAEKTPEFVQLTLGLSQRKRNQIDTINKVQLERQYDDSTKHRQVRLGLIEVLFGVSGFLVIIGTILAMSELHNVKIAAVWVFVAAAIAALIALAVRLTHEFSKPGSDQSSDTDRAWVSPIAFAGEPKVNQPFTVYVRYKNTGKTIAKDVSVVFFAYGVRKDTKPDFGIVENESPTGGSVFFLEPGAERASYHTHNNGKPLTRDDVMQVDSGNIVIYVFGKIYYRDVSDCSHWTKFCVFYVPSLKQYSNYGEYNYTDENKCN